MTFASCWPSSVFGFSILLLLVFQSVLKTFEHELLTNVLDRLPPASKSVRDLLISPRRTIHIGLEQDMSPPDFLARAFEPVDHIFTQLSFLLPSTAQRRSFA